MPSKQYLMSLPSASAIVSYAEANLGLHPVIQSIRYTTDKQVEVVINPDLHGERGNPDYDGVAPTKKEALAECVSVNFPPGLYPDPQ